MTVLVKLIQNQFKKKKKKEKTEEVLVFNSLSLLVTLIIFNQNSSSMHFQSLNAYMTADTVNTVLTDYDLYASFIADNESDSHIIN